jgi:hypothetical protein
MDIESILAELRREKDRIESAISSLLGTSAPARRGRPPGKAAEAIAQPATKQRKVMSPAARKRISEAMKKKWAEKRKKAKSQPFTRP